MARCTCASSGSTSQRRPKEATESLRSRSVTCLTFDTVLSGSGGGNGGGGGGGSGDNGGGL